MNKLSRKLISNGSWASAGKVISIISVLFINGLIARLLDPDQVGLYFLLFSLVTIISIAAQLGLNQAVVRIISEQLGRGSTSIANFMALTTVKIVLSSTFMVSIISAITVFIFLNEIGSIKTFSNYTPFLVILWFALLTTQGIFSECFRGYHDIKSSTIYGGALTNIFLALSIFFLWLNTTDVRIDHVIALSAFAILINLMFSFTVFRRFTTRQPAPHEKPTRNILSIAWPIWTTNITLIILTHADIWIVGTFLSTSDAALYGAAIRLVSVIGISLLVVNSVIAPVIVELYYKNNISQLQSILALSASLASIPAVAILLAEILFGEVILKLLFGPFYENGYPILVILGIGQCFNVLSGSCGLVLFMTGHQKYMMYITIFTSTIAVILSVLFAVVFRNSAVIAIVFSSALVVQNLLMLFVVRRRIKILTFADFRLSSLYS